MFASLNSLSGQQSIYNCTTDIFYQNENGRLYAINIDNDFSSYTISEVGTNVWPTDEIINLGYDAYENVAYGIDDMSPGYPHLVKIDSVGNREFILSFGDRENSFNTFNSGTTSLSGEKYYAFRRANILNGDIVALPFLFRFDLTITPVTYDSIPIQTLSGTDLVNAFDIAINPIDGLAYGYDPIDEKLITLNLETGIIDDLKYPTVDDINLRPELFGLKFTAFGDIIGFNNQPYFRMVTVDVTSGLITKEISGGPEFPNPRSDDGFSCPYTIGLRQRALTDTITPCTDFTAELIIGVVSDGNNVMELRDTFPAGFVVEEVLRNPYGGSVAGLGTNRFTLSDFTSGNGVDTILLRVSTSPGITPGAYTFQASLNDIAGSISAFPANTILSDYLPTPAGLDPSPVFVRELADEVPATDFQRCSGEVVTLDPFSAVLDEQLVFAWSTGAASPEIVVETGGDFTLITTSPCGDQDTIVFTVADGSVSVDLGEDLTVPYGTVITLDPTIETTAELASLGYTTTDPSILSCTDCPNPVASPTNLLTALRLDVTTIFGCSASDSLTITLTRDVYQPTAFSPNGDDTNDCFTLFTGGAAMISLDIYTRWGNLVYSGGDGVGDCPAGWDGQLNGETAPAGVYTYVAEIVFPDGEREVLHGEVVLMR